MPPPSSSSNASRREHKKSYKQLNKQGKNIKKKAPIIKKQNASKAIDTNALLRKRGRTSEIVFDPEARRDYLTGFSARKQQRRAYGLAMQKVKDRKAKLEGRKDAREAELERIEEAEQLKEQAFQAALEARGLGDGGGTSDKDDDDSDDDKKSNKKKQKKSNSKDKAISKDGKDDTGKVATTTIGSQDTNKASTTSDTTTAAAAAAASSSSKQPTTTNKKSVTTFYHDEATQQQWGGDVVVTTSTALPDSDDEWERNQRRAAKKFRSEKNSDDKKARRVDAAQEYAGNVDKYLLKLKGNMPGKKKGTQGNKHRGMHGAADMKGIGSGKVIKIAQKALARSTTKGGGGGGGKRKKGK